MKKFPVLISIPHGGTRVPPELMDRICIEERDIVEDMDPFTRQIYDLESWVMETVTTDIARAFIDLNRALDDLPPKNPDGVVKSVTCYKKPIYKQGMEPDKALVKTLIDLYYRPYHRRLRQLAFRNKELALALDCHSMAEHPPPIAPDSAQEKRPLICLGNNHDQACDRHTVETLATCFREAFELEEADVTINQPFAGGYITRSHGKHPLPWVQVELNRSLYLSDPWYDPVNAQIDQCRLLELNAKFHLALELFFSEKTENAGYTVMPRQC